MPRSEIKHDYPTLPLSVCKIIILRGFSIPFLCPIHKVARPPAIKKICAIIKFYRVVRLHYESSPAVLPIAAIM